MHHAPPHYRAANDATSIRYVSEQADDAPVSSPASGPSRRGRRWAVAIASAVALAVLGATASALITPERLNNLFGLFGSGVSYKTVATSDGALTLDVPDTWAARDASYNVTPTAGSAILSGTQVRNPLQVLDEGAYAGASADATGQMSMAGFPADPADPDFEQVAQAFGQAIVDEADWTQVGCTATKEPTRRVDGWVVASQAWKDCADTEGTRVWDIALVKGDGSVFAFLQVFLPSGRPASIVDTTLNSLLIDPRKLPTGVVGENPTFP